MRISFIPVASIIAALSLFSVGAFAATTPDTATASSSDASEVPTACLIDTAPTSSNPIVTATATTAAGTATPTATTTAATTPAADNDATNTVEDTTGQAIRACIAALHDDGQHGIGQTVSELAHELKAERHADNGGVSADDDSSPLVSVTPTTTSTTSASIVTPATIIQDGDHKPKSEHGNSRGGKHGRG